MLPLLLAVGLLWAEKVPGPFLNERLFPWAPWEFWVAAFVAGAGMLFTVWARIRQAASTAPARRPVSQPNLPTVSEFGYKEFNLVPWMGVFLPAGAPPDIVRKLEAEYSRPIGILVDLQGPKLRIGKFESGSLRLTEGEVVSFVRRESVGGLGRVHLPHPEIFAALEPGASLLVNDGKIRLQVDTCGKDFANCVVEVGGTISNRKGVNVPGTVLALSPLTKKDRTDLAFGLELGATLPTGHSGIVSGKTDTDINAIYSADLGDWHTDLNDPHVRDYINGEQFAAPQPRCARART